jgi:hypothetical protein
MKLLKAVTTDLFGHKSTNSININTAHYIHMKIISDSL